MTGAAALLAACGGQNEPTASPLATRSPLPTPTPRPPLSPLATPDGHQVFLPYIENRPPATEVVSLLPPEPTLTPTPTKTATPRPPTPTPTPAATPFPPGPPSKLGIFVGHNDPELFKLLETQAIPVVKTLELDANFLAQIKQTSPNTKIIGRIDLPQLNLATMDPIAAAQDYLNILLPYADDPERRQYIDAWEAYNEPVAANAEEMRKLATFESERTRLLGERGIRSVIGNFGTGQPPMELWPEFLPAVQTAQQYDGWLGLHEYAAPTIYFLSTAESRGRYPGVTPADSGWLTLRYRKVYNEILKPAGLAIPLVFTELGVDGLVQDRPGPAGWPRLAEFPAVLGGKRLWSVGARRIH